MFPGPGGPGFFPGPGLMMGGGGDMMGLPPQMQNDRRDNGDDGEDAKGSVFYKTRLCNIFMQGHCKFGPTCKYAHGEAELRPMQAEAIEIARRLEQRRAQEQQQQPGGPGGLPKPPDMMGRGDVPMQGMQGMQGHGMQEERGGGPQGTKKHLCHKFMKTGACSYGDNCKFAHGYEEKGQGGPSGGPDGMPGGGGGGMPGGGGRGGGRGGGMGAGMGGGMGLGGGDMPLGMMEPFGSGGLGPPGMGPPGMGPQGMGPPAMGPGGMGGGMRPPLMPMHGPMVPPGPPIMGQGAPQMGTPPGAPPRKGGGPPPAAKQQGPPPAAATPAATAAPSGKAGPEVAFVDRVRAVCSLLGIGSAEEAVREKPAALQHAIATIKNGSAFRENPFADSVEHLL